MITFKTDQEINITGRLNKDSETLHTALVSLLNDLKENGEGTMSLIYTLDIPAMASLYLHKYSEEISKLGETPTGWVEGGVDIRVSIVYEISEVDPTNEILLLEFTKEENGQRALIRRYYFDDLSFFDDMEEYGDAQGYHYSLLFRFRGKSSYLTAVSSMVYSSLAQQHFPILAASILKRVPELPTVNFESEAMKQVKENLIQLLSNAGNIARAGNLSVESVNLTFSRPRDQDKILKMTAGLDISKDSFPVYSQSL